MRWMLGLVLFFPAAALAQSEPPPLNVGPKPNGPFVCQRDYPLQSMKKGEMGSATVLFRLSSEGEVKNVVVAATSGSEALDNETAACAKQLHLYPATYDGKPVESLLSTAVEWLINTSKWRVSLVLRQPLDLCLSPDEAVNHRFGWGAPITAVSYTLKDGEIIDAAVKKSSGDAELDKKAVACVQRWHFKPQTEDPNIAVWGTFISGPNALQDPKILKERTPASLAPRPASGPGLATFDWREFGAK